MTVSAFAVQRESLSKISSESFYAEWNGDKFVRVKQPDLKLPAAAENVYTNFRAHISNEDFSCVGAKAAFNGKIFRLGFYHKMNAPETNAVLAHDLRLFAEEQKKSSTNYASFAAIFDAPSFENENAWESSLWAQIENLHKLDNNSIWDSSVSSDPEDANFSFSFAETGFFIVGLHPQSSRLARRFSHPTMVFNPHAQFERLRELEQYERLQKTIRARELKLQGSLNPNLSDFGTKSEARQYSGRAVEEHWKCPFHAQMQKAT
jgi:FPC/CPF motif-containing protein YcgG